MKSVNMAIDIKSTQYIVPEQGKIESEDSVLFRSDFQSANEFVSEHEKMVESNKNRQNL